MPPFRLPVQSEALLVPAIIYYLFNPSGEALAG